MTKALVPLANGCEEMEAVIVIDTLRRAGWDVTAASLQEGPITASRGVKLLADATWDDLDLGSFDIIIVPGGQGGTEKLMADERILAALRAHHGNQKPVAAICAGPLVLQAAGLLEGMKITSHPVAAKQFTNCTRIEDRVVCDGLITTSQGPGTSFEFALSLIARFDGEEKAKEIAAAMVL